MVEDLEYFRKHVLICMFMGMRVSLQFLHPWICKTWNWEGDFDISLVANIFF